MKEVLEAKGFSCANSERVLPSCSGLFNYLKRLQEFVTLLSMSRTILEMGVLSVIVKLLFSHNPILHVEP